MRAYACRCAGGRAFDSLKDFGGKPSGAGTTEKRNLEMIRTLFVAGAAVAALSLTACQKQEEAAETPAAEATATAPEAAPAAPAADASATAAAPAEGAPAADASATAAPAGEAMPEKK